ncbi:mannitol dehydrogenase family protein [Sphingomonas sp. RRHST34]|uniref:Mannitol dehydrogenase family protein n=1 Tax=Sphingomonas citri TaxID=2862499 RepID=A0ABS7BND7_9SPHN|nr:mannitol dehydrogenase family protein [Sphingomonas citri]MBW6531118.1 mannitol dehydrogenase family protein [Sphingomonas citri]
MSGAERLSPATVDRLPASVERPGYDRAVQRTGIVHLGLGAFHRAHQAVYTDAAMSAGDRDFAITGVSLRSPAVAEALLPQDGLYTVTQRSAAGERIALVGALREMLVAPRDGERLRASLAAPTTSLVTLTVTEKGYHRGPDGALDIASVEAAGGTIYHHLARALADRRGAGAGGLTLVSCDNLAHNGAALAASLGAWLDRTDPGLRAWFEAECACPSTMVDRIVPAAREADLERTAAAIGLYDAAAVTTEPFMQWVIEDKFATRRPRWELAGAQLVADVAPYEFAKLRMLNGAHSALAYLGLERGHQFVHQAVADPAIRATVERLMRDEAAASLTAAPGQDLGAYADALLARFTNPALPHALIQIAMDGSQKIPQRWLATLRANAAEGRRCPAILTALAAWLRHVRGNGAPVNDPMAEQLAALWREVGEHGIVAALFGERGLFADHWQADAEDRAALHAGLREG